jgi:hypothetical protein
VRKAVLERNGEISVIRMPHVFTVAVENGVQTVKIVIEGCGLRGLSTRCAAAPRPCKNRAQFGTAVLLLSSARPAGTQTVGPAAYFGKAAPPSSVQTFSAWPASPPPT